MYLRRTALVLVALLAGPQSIARGESHIAMRSDLKLGVDTIEVDGQVVARIEHAAGRRVLRSDEIEVRLEERRSQPDGAPYPEHVEVSGFISGDLEVRQEYDLLAPLSPIEVEGFGVPFAGDAPDQNTAEHARLQAWLGEQGLAADTELFEALHRSRTNRDLRVWYEIAGRRVDGALYVGGASQPAARFGSGFHVVEDGWKIHHTRELFYHRKSLEMADTVTDLSAPGAPLQMSSYQCGCYGWAIGGDWVTIGDRYLYHAEVEWAHHRVGAGFYLGIEGRSTFPWVGLSDRDRIGLLARRAAAYRITDAKGDLFAEVRIELDPDPPAIGLGPQSYEFLMAGTDGALVPVATAALSSAGLEVVIAQGSSLDRLDVLLASMPTQVLRGDGIRDSYLGEVETLVDWLRLLSSPGEGTLADVVSEVDALTAVDKVSSLLAPHGERFLRSGSDYQPLPPLPVLPPGSD